MSAPAVQAVAEALPFRDRSFDASMGIFTVHHWADQTEGLAELQRVARRRIVIVTSDPEVEQFFWLNELYFPALTRLDRDRVMGPEALLDRLGPGKVIRVPVPHDCEDGFCSAYWRRPEAYLDPKVRAGISYFAAMDQKERADGLRRLAEDLRSGAWQERFGHLLALNELDTTVWARPPRPSPSLDRRRGH